MERSLRSRSDTSSVSSTKPTEKPLSPGLSIVTSIDWLVASEFGRQHERAAEMLFVGGGRLQRPEARQLDRGLGVEHAEAHLAVEHQAAAIDVGAPFATAPPACEGFAVIARICWMSR